jgi:hypothetical protein
MVQAISVSGQEVSSWRLNSVGISPALLRGPRWRPARLNGVSKARTGITGVQFLGRPETAGGARLSMAERLATSGRSDG